MTQADDSCKSETVAVDGHVLTQGCRYRPEQQRWEPFASVRSAWDSSREVALPDIGADLQDTPEDALGVARASVQAWLRAHPTPGPGA